MSTTVKMINLNIKGVSLTDKYTDTLWFDTVTQQIDYFELCKVATFPTQVFINPYGGIIKIKGNPLTLIECNYVAFQNTDKSDKWFYGFVEYCDYENETNCGTVHFTLDYVQSFLFDVTFNPCMVEREHSLTDNIGDNIVPEDLYLGDYIDNKVTTIEDHLEDTLSYDPTSNVTVIFASADYRTIGPNGEGTGCAGFFGSKMQGVYNGLGIYFSLKSKNKQNVGGVMKYVYCSIRDDMKYITPGNASFVSDGWVDYCIEDADGLAWGARTITDRIDRIGNSGSDRSEIVSLVTVPITFLTRITTSGVVSDYWVDSDYNYTPIKISYEKPKSTTPMDGYVPKNKKLYTYPFNVLYVSNNQGGCAEYKFEYNTEPFPTDYFLFNLVATVAPTPSYTLIPKYYKNNILKSEEIISISNYPQCAYSCDVSKAWLVNNAGNLMTTAGTIAITAATGGVTAPLLATTALNTMGSIVQTAMQPDTAKNVNGGSTQQAIGRFTFTFIEKSLNAYYLKKIDDFFTAFGYAYKKIKVPNRQSRSSFNYTKTVNCSISGDCSSSVIKKLESIHDNGIRYWKRTATFGNYTQSNN